eukprot:jgi/Mesvir1/18675/Mv17172-RA.1
MASRMVASSQLLAAKAAFSVAATKEAPRRPRVACAASLKACAPRASLRTPASPSFLTGRTLHALPALPVRGHNASRSLICKAQAEKSETMEKMEKLFGLLTNLFPVWVLMGTGIGLTKPELVTWISTDMFTWMLGILMLSMGLTLTFDDFRQVMKQPFAVLVGFFGQYGIKPFLGYVIAQLLGLPPALATGLILVSCCPGGQASNVATYIAKGDVALSVLMTTCSTVSAIIMTPLLTKVLAGTLVPVDAQGLALSTFQVVLLPTIVGVLTNEYASGLTAIIKPFTPLMGVVMTTLLCASPIGQVSEILKTKGAALLAPVFALHAAAFLMGYYLPRWLGMSEKAARTVSIETGMQSSALGFVLAQKHFADPLVQVPSAVSVVCMAVLGSALAVFWRMVPLPESEQGTPKAA